MPVPVPRLALRGGPSRTLRAVGGAAALLLLAACHSAPDDPGAVSPDEDRQLNDAAAMLDANSVSVNEVVPPNESQP